jgi:XTP/dITP diphosphohydrolase
MNIVFATNNEHKLREIQHILGGSFNLLSLIDLKIDDDIPENEPTLEGNALHKARHVHALVGMDVFADDTGLEIDALGGAPGVHSARFAGENRDSAANIEKVHSLMGPGGNRKARFRTIIALIFDGKEYLFEGMARGIIISERRGERGFGYDPVFVPDGHELTFAEMSLDEKNKISHRAAAFEKLRVFLSGHNPAGNKQE